MGLGVVWERAAYRDEKRQIGQGVVLEHVYGKETWLEKWRLGRGEEYAVTGPARVVQWLAGRVVHHITQLAKYVITRHKVTDGGCPPKRRKTLRDRGPGTEAGQRRRHQQAYQEWHAARAEVGEWRWMESEERVPEAIRGEYEA